VHRLARGYGSRAEALLADGLGEAVAPGLHEAELRHLHEQEWARSADDVLWRRTKLGLHLTAAQRQDVARWWAARWPGETTTTHTGDSVRTTTWS
jgi:glycerol-3-phosphate dehydrogenase